MTRLCAALVLAPLSGCSIAAVDYGEIRHAEYVADPRCTPQPGAAVDGEALPYFFATSRLPDCRTPEIELLHHRGDRLRYGRFNAPRDVAVGKKEKFLTPDRKSTRQTSSP